MIAEIPSNGNAAQCSLSKSKRPRYAVYKQPLIPRSSPLSFLSCTLSLVLRLMSYTCPRLPLPI